ncbi:MAG: hypothetical protein AB8B66_02390 [Rickettsiaceae bacterium]
MISDYIGGGQVFLHKVRVLRQVIGMTILVAVLAGGVLSWYFNKTRMNQVDWSGAITYAKADILLTVHPVLSKISINGKTKATIDAYSNGQLWKRRMLAQSVITSPKFKMAWRHSKSASAILLWQGLAAGIISGLLLFFFWRKFGLDLKTDRKKEGSGSVLSADKVNNVLKKLNKNSDLTIGKMCLVKEMETRHFLVTGATGSGNRVERPLTESPSHTTVRAMSHTAVSDLCLTKESKMEKS